MGVNFSEHIIKDEEKLSELINLNEDEKHALNISKYKWSITKHFISLMDKNNSNCPIRKQFIPSVSENFPSMYDGYLLEKENRQDKSIPNCIARQYKDRIAFLVSKVCPSYCRFCFRKEAILNDSLNLEINIDEGIKWISDHKEIRDVLITGGDPLMLSNIKLSFIIEKLRCISHIEMIRIGTRIPVGLPQRIDDDFLNVIKGFHRVPIWINIQCNHPKEITPELIEVVYKMTTCGVNVSNQAVLLKGINDDFMILRKLHQKLLSIRVRPYYIFHCEPAPGNDRFRTTYKEGCDLMDKAFYKHTTGMARPIYVVAKNTGKEECRRLL